MDSEPDLEIELTDEAPLSSSPVEASPLSIGTDQYGDAECGRRDSIPSRRGRICLHRTQA